MVDRMEKIELKIYKIHKMLRMYENAFLQTIHFPDFPILNDEVTDLTKIFRKMNY